MAGVALRAKEMRRELPRHDTNIFPQFECAECRGRITKGKTRGNRMPGVADPAKLSHDLLEEPYGDRDCAPKARFSYTQQFRGPGETQSEGPNRPGDILQQTAGNRLF